MIIYHETSGGSKVAEVMPGKVLIETSQDILDLMVDAGYSGCQSMIIHSGSLKESFFDLKSGLAGDILQKFSNYRMKLSIIGDFSSVESKSLRDFIRESNNRGIIRFVGSLEEALQKTR